MKTFISLVLLLQTLSLRAQDTIPKGVGELKVGETKISFIDEVAAQSKKKIKRLSEFSTTDDARYHPYIVEYVKPLTKCSDAGNPLIPEHRVFVVYNYALMNQFHSPKIYLEFYNDVLYHFTVADPQFMGIFKAKYGQPVTDEILHNSNCAKEIGGSSPTEKDIVESWDSGNIHAAYLTAESRNSGDCDKVVKTTFEVKDMETHKIVQVLEHEALKRCQSAEEQDKTVIVPDNF